MIMFPGMLIGPAKEAGIKVPDDADSYIPKDYPHFHVFCIVQLGAPLPSWTAHWENAKIISTISEEKIMEITCEELRNLGLQIY